MGINFGFLPTFSLPPQGTFLDSTLRANYGLFDFVPFYGVIMWSVAFSYVVYY